MLPFYKIIQGVHRVKLTLGWISSRSICLILIFLSFDKLYSQTRSDSLLIDNHQRTFRYTFPVLPGSSLVFVLHGSGGSGEDMMSRTPGLLQAAKTEKVVFVYPDGYKKYWNECRKEASSLANLENIDENAFFGQMIEYFKKRYQTDPSRVFSVGTSGGGHMSYKLALTMPQKLTAITAIIANLPDTENLDCMESRIALPVMIVNGTADPLNRYEGGIMQSGNFRMGKVRSTDQTFRYWAELAGYAGPPIKSLVEDTDPSDQKTIERYTYREHNKPEIVLLKVIGGKHDYPNDIDVHLEAWAFFKRQIR